MSAVRGTKSLHRQSSLSPANNAQLESLDQAWRNLEIIAREVTSGGKHAVRSTGRFARDTVASPRVQKAVIGTTLLAIAGILLYIPAALGYLYFYYKFLPELETTAPVHLQYGYVDYRVVALYQKIAN